MNKNKLILLALAATAHVYGADSTLNKHYRESILGKRAYPDPNANNNLAAKRQKTDQNPPEQSDSPRLRELKQRLAKSGPISVVTHYLPMSDALKMFAVSKKIREKLKGFLPEKYNNATKQWEKVKRDDKLNGCVVHCRTTLRIPGTTNAIRGLPGIIRNKKVDHIIIGRLNPNPRPEGLVLINSLFTDHNPNNNSLTFKVVQPNNRDVRWNMGDFLPNVSHVKNVIFEGANGNERLDIKVPDDVGNKCVTIRNFSNGTLKQDPYTIDMAGQDCEITLKRDNINLTNSNGNIDLNKDNPGDEFSTYASGLNVQMTAQTTAGNEIVMAKSDNGQVSHCDYTEFAVTNTEASGLNPKMTVALGTIQGLRTIDARSDTNVMQKDIWLDDEGVLVSDDYLNSISIAEGPNSTIRRHGNSITIEGDTKAERTEYDNEDPSSSAFSSGSSSSDCTVSSNSNGDRKHNIRRFEFIAEGKKRENAGIGSAELTRPQIIIDDKLRTMTTSNRYACCTSYEKGKIDYRTCAYGTNAKVTLCENEGGITGEADRGVCHAEYYKNGKPFSRTTAGGIPATHATLSMTGTGKIEGKGNNGLLHQRFFDNGALGIHAAVNGNAKLTVEDSGAIKGETNTQAQYTRWNKEGAQLSDERAKGNAELHMTPQGKGEIRRLFSARVARITPHCCCCYFCITPSKT